MYGRKPFSSMLCPYFTYLERNHVLQLYKNCFLCSKSCLKDVNPTKQAEIGDDMTFGIKANHTEQDTLNS